MSKNTVKEDGMWHVLNPVSHEMNKVGNKHHFDSKYLFRVVPKIAKLKKKLLT